MLSTYKDIERIILDYFLLEAETNIETFDSIHSEYPNLERPRQIKWIPPPLGWVELNSDASRCPKKNCFRLGWVVCDLSKTLLTNCQFKDLNFRIQVVELKVVLEGLSVACLGWWNRIVVETYTLIILSF